MAPALWPQLVLKENQLALCGDWPEMEQFGHRRFVWVFARFLKRARHSLINRPKRPLWIWEPQSILPEKGHYPPRVFVRKRISEISNKTHFICRYERGFPQQKILFLIDKWSGQETQRYVRTLGERETEASFSFQPRRVERALVKIGINLLAYLCKKTPITESTFPAAVRFVRHDRGGGPPSDLTGFAPAQITRKVLECRPKHHTFRLTYHTGAWVLECAFYEGKLGAVTAFPGPNKEPWLRADILVPIGASKWVIKRSNLVMSNRIEGTWSDFWTPDENIRNIRTGIRVEKPRVI